MLLLVSLQCLCSLPGAWSPFMAGYPPEPYLASELQELGSKRSMWLVPQTPAWPGCAVLGHAVPWWLEARMPRRVLAASLACAPRNAGGPPCRGSRPVPCCAASLPSLIRLLINQHLGQNTGLKSR